MPDEAASVSGVSRARHAQQDPCDRSHYLGAVVRGLRVDAGLSMSALARRSAYSPSTISRLERGELGRPRPSLLAGIAWGLDPDRAAELRRELFSAAGDWLAVDTPGWLRYRTRRMTRGTASGDVPLLAEHARRIAAHRRASEARRAAYAIVDRRGPLTYDDLAKADELMEIAAEADAEAGGVIVVCGVAYGYM